MSKWKSSKVKAITTLKSLTDPFSGLFGPDIKAKVGFEPLHTIKVSQNNR